MTEAKKSLLKRIFSFRNIVTSVTLLGGVALIFVVMTSKPKPQRGRPEIPAPSVRVIEAQPTSVQINVDTQGTVTPKREIDVVAEVGGKIIEVAPKFVSGGYFKKGDVLIRIDPRDYEYALTRAEAQLASAKQRLALEEAEAEQARRDWVALGEVGEPTPLVLREPQLAEARANLNSAQAQLLDAKLDLERATIRAPFDGRVREKRADLGQYVNPGAGLGRVFSTDIAEIRLPLTDRQLSYLGLPYRPQDDVPAVPVTIRATFAGKLHEWRAYIHRTEGAIDERSRVLYAVAEVIDPYSLLSDRSDVVPLSMGLFVEAEISGNQYDNVFALPRSALREANQLILVDEDEKLKFITVDVLRSDRETAYIQSGLTTGARVMSSVLENPVDGMIVRIYDDEQTGREEPSISARKEAVQGGQP